MESMKTVAAEQPWMKSFGKLRDLHEETQRINRIIEEEFGQVGQDSPCGGLQPASVIHSREK